MPLGVRDMLLVIRAKDQATRTLLQVGAGFNAISRNVNALSREQQGIINLARDHNRVLTESETRHIAAIGKQQELLRAQEANARQNIATGQSLVAVGAGFAVVGGAAVAGFGVATKAAAEYNRESALTFTQLTQNLKDTGAEISDLEQIGMRVARNFPAPFEQMQDTLYDIFSSTNANIQESEVLLTAFSKGAVAGQVDLQKAGQATISLMNAFKVPFQDVTRVMDIQFAIVRGGRITYEELTAVIGRSIPSAVRAGQTMEVLGGMIAFLTRNGLSAAMASTSAARALDLFSNPKFANELEKIGVRVADVHGKFRPLPDVIRDLRARFGELSGAQKTMALLKIGGEGSAEAFAQLGIKIHDAQGNVRDFNDVSAELEERFKGLSEEQVSEALKEMTKGAGGTIQAMRFLNLAVADNDDLLEQLTGEVERSAGAQEAAYRVMADTPAMKLQQLKNRYQILKVEIGQALIPVLERLTDWLGRVLGWWERLDDGTQRTIVRVGAITAALTTLLGIVTVMGGALQILSGTLTLVLGPAMAGVIGTTLGVIALGAATATAAFLVLTKVLGVDTATAIQIITSLLMPFTIPINIIIGLARVLGIEWSDVWGAMRRAVEIAWAVIEPIWGFIKEGLGFVKERAIDLKNFWVDDAWPAITRAVELAWSLIEPVWEKVKEGITFVKDRAVDLKDFWVDVMWPAMTRAVEEFWDKVEPLFAVLEFWLRLLKAVATELLEAWGRIFRAMQYSVEQFWGIVLPIFEAVVGFIDGSLNPTIMRLWDTWVNRAWNPMAGALRGVWDNHIYPVMESMAAFIENRVIPAINKIHETADRVFDAFNRAATFGFNAAKDNIGVALRAMGEMVGRFLGTVASVADAVGLDHVARVLRDAEGSARAWGHAQGGILATDAVQLARGGLAPFKTDGIRAIVGEGNPAYPEYVLATDPLYDSKNKKLWAEYGKKKGLLPPMYAEGGIIGALKSAFETVTDPIEWTVERVRDLAAAGLERLWPELGVENNIQSIPPAALNALRRDVINLIANEANNKAQDEARRAAVAEAAVAGAGGSANIGGLTAAASAMVDAVLRAFPGARMTSGYRSPAQNAAVGGAPNSDHMYGRAADFVGPDMNGIAAFLRRYPGIKQVLWQVAGHFDHVHGAVYDKGGLLSPGLNFMFNNTGSYEALIPVQRMEQSIDELSGDFHDYVFGLQKQIDERLIEVKASIDLIPPKFDESTAELKNISTQVSEGFNHSLAVFDQIAQYLSDLRNDLTDPNRQKAGYRQAEDYSWVPESFYQGAQAAQAAAPAVQVAQRAGLHAPIGTPTFLTPPITLGGFHGVYVGQDTPQGRYLVRDAEGDWVSPADINRWRSLGPNDEKWWTISPEWVARNTVGTFQRGGIVPQTGLGFLHQGEMVIPSNLLPPNAFFNAGPNALSQAWDIAASMGTQKDLSDIRQAFRVIEVVGTALSETAPGAGGLRSLGPARLANIFNMGYGGLGYSSTGHTPGMFPSPSGYKQSSSLNLQSGAIQVNITTTSDMSADDVGDIAANKIEQSLKQLIHQLRSMN